MAKGSEVAVDVDGSVQIINETDVSTDAVMGALRQSPELAAMVRWSSDVQGGGSPARRQGSMFERDRYVIPQNHFQEIQTARDAAESDDIVSGVLESTEALAFSRMAIECDDSDEQDIWNQIMGDLDMDARLREIWRETYMVSNCYVGIWWGRKNYKVRGKTQKGVTRKKTFDNLQVPLGLTVLDPLKVVPVGNFMFNQEDLCYVADRTEQDSIDSFLAGKSDPTDDPIISQMIVQKYQPNSRDRKQLGAIGFDVNRLYLMNPNSVFRHTATRPQYQRFATVRLKSVFEVLDLKHQLRQRDRAMLVGGTNFIILIKKGSDTIPAEPEEIANLQSQVTTIARVPVIVGDHRLSIEIITPKQDHTLEPQLYEGVDSRIRGRLYGMLTSGGSGGSGGRGDDSVKLARVIARGLESRRLMQRRTLERYVIMPTFRLNEAFTAEPSMRFYPKRIALDFDVALATFLSDLRATGDLSRASVLSEVDYSEEDEARKRQEEKEKYDDIFAPPTPPIAPMATAPGAPAQKRAGRTQGGNRNGGGAAPGSGQGQPARRPAKKSSTSGTNKPVAAELEREDEIAELLGRLVEILDGEEEL